MRPALRVALLAAATVLGGLAMTACGGNPADQEGEVRAAAERFLQAGAEGDAEALCASLAPGSLTQLGGRESCVRTLRRQLQRGEGDLSALSGLEIASVDVSEEAARVNYEGDAPPTRMVKEDGTWYVAATPGAGTG